MKLLYNFLVHNKQRWLTIQVLFLSAWARLLLRFVPVQKLRPFLGKEGTESPRGSFAAEQRRFVGHLAYRVARVAKRTPWQSKCFVRAMVAQWLLKSRHLPSTLYLGVGKNESQAMIAHAWIRSGDYYVAGGDGSGYATVARFTCIPRRCVVPCGTDAGAAKAAIPQGPEDAQ